MALQHKHNRIGLSRQLQHLKQARRGRKKEQSKPAEKKSSTRQEARSNMHLLNRPCKAGDSLNYQLA